MNNEIQRLHFEMKRLHVQLEQLRAQVKSLQEKDSKKSVIETAKEVRKELETNLNG